MNIYEKMKEIIKFRLTQITQSGFATSLDYCMQIPQDYSFVVFGLHGSGLHSLLYYLSLCRDQDNHNIYPMPFHIFSNNFDFYGHLKCLRFLRTMRPILKKKQIKCWGLTLDGTKHQQIWLERNIKKKTPMIILVRDPILRLISIVNHEIFFHIHSQRFTSKEKIFKQIIERDIINSGQSPSIPNARFSKKIFIDNIELSASMAYSTIQKLANYLDANVSFNKSFQHSINSPMQRYFTIPIVCNNQRFYLSSYPDLFHITCYPYYLTPNYCDKLGYTHSAQYINQNFYNQNLWIFSNKPINMNSDLQNKINDYLATLKNMLEKYDRFKINTELFFSLAKKYDFFHRIQDFIQEESLTVPQKITQNWTAYHMFLGS